ncbi:M23 family metallopeptidase [Candidatus Gracilibacteria bacterium]|nr:M23 family metallopeptidase [Candidatus Gracilibacteria bacterium]
MPILYIPDWSKAQYQNKTIQFFDIPISDYVPLPFYDPVSLLDIKNQSKQSLINHYTYITTYMGSYRLNYREYDGSHNAIDIRAPIGTPVLSIANGVVVRTVDADFTGNKFIVVRHDGVTINGRVQSLYSGYLHLSEINIREGTKVRKGDMIGRVGISGITTTPHLHIQIDTEDAPFHPYWPFTSNDSKVNGLSIFESVNAGLGKENAQRYSINPMSFINQYANGVTVVNALSALENVPQFIKEKELTPINASLESIVASMKIGSTALSKTTITQGSATLGPSLIANRPCEKKRFSDMPSSSTSGKLLYAFIDEYCMFQNIEKFDPSSTITQKDAIVILMQYYKVPPTTGISHFLDIAIGDSFQGYAISSSRRGVLDGNYARPDKLLSKEDFIELVVKIGKLEKNPSQIKIYSDTSAMNFKFQYIQDFAFKVRARGGNFYPQTLLTRQGAIELLGKVQSRDQVKK